MSAAAEWKPKLRWLMRRILVLRPSRRPLERPRRMAARMPSRWARRVRASADERREPGARGPGQPGVEVRGREARGRRGGRAAGALRAAGRRGRAGGWPAGPRRAWRAGRAVWRSGALSSDQRVPLTQRPVGVCERSWAFHSSRRTWSVARLARRQTWKGSKQISACGIGGADGALVLAAHVDRDRADRAPCARRARRRSACKVALLRPGAHHTIAPGGVVGDRRSGSAAPCGVGVGGGAPFRPCGRWFPRRRPPNRTCEFPRIRLSTSTASVWSVMRAPVGDGRGVRDRRGWCAGSASRSDRRWPRSTASRSVLPGSGSARRACRPGCRARSRVPGCDPCRSSAGGAVFHVHCGCFLRSQPTTRLQA